MDKNVMTRAEVEQRAYWVEEISRLSGNFGVDAERVEQEVSSEIKTKGASSLLGHLRLCGAIPERYGHDSSEEKLVLRTFPGGNGLDKLGGCKTSNSTSRF